MSHDIRGYASDLTQQEWEVIEPFLCCERKWAGRPMALDTRMGQTVLVICLYWHIDIILTPKRS